MGEGGGGRGRGGGGGVTCHSHQTIKQECDITALKEGESHLRRKRPEELFKKCG